MYLAGPLWARIAFRGFMAVVGTLMLAGAVNTSIVGSNGVLNRVSEDGILPQWFRHPQRKFGTTHRILNLVVILQIVTIVLSRGDIFLLGEAYAFGVMWSFAMKGLAVLVLRYKHRGEREFRVPFNFKIGRTRNSDRAGLDHADACGFVRHQSAHEAGRDDFRRGVHADLLRDFFDHRKNARRSARPNTRNSTNSIWKPATISLPKDSACGPEMFW